MPTGELGKKANLCVMRNKEAWRIGGPDTSYPFKQLYSRLSGAHAFAQFAVQYDRTSRTSILAYE
jgi:hypothetical protein